MRTTLLTAVASLLLSLWSLVARADAAPALPMCGAGQWVLPAPTIGIGIAGSAVQTVVLGADGTVALTGACPPIAAKVKAIRTGTSVKASWPAGFCGGVGGKGKLAATIDAACLTMQGKFSAAKLKRIFEAPRSPCDVDLLDTGGTPRCVAPAIATGNAATHATLDDAGCLVSDVTVTTASGVSAHLASGSCLVAGKKPLKGGDVEIALDDAGGPPSAAGVVGIVRLRVRPKGKGVPLVVDVEPPATLTLPLADAFSGTWFTNAFLDSGGFTATLHDATPVLLDAVPVANGTGQAGIAIAGPVGLSFESPNATSTVRARRTRAAGFSTVSFVIPPDPNLPDPRVVHWKVINPKTAQIVMVGLPFDELGVGDSDTRVRQGHLFHLSVLESSGQRRVELTSDVANRFVIALGLRDGTNGNENTVFGDAVGGCADETCLADAYIGFVKVTARAKNFAEVVTVRDTIAGQLPAGAVIAIRAVRPVGRRTQGVMTIFGLEASAQTLVGVLPTSWAVAASDRTLDIDTHPANVLGDWQGTMVITGPGGSSPFGCSPNDPLCARLSVQSVPGGLRIAYCNSLETQCGGSAASQPCALIFDGHATAAGLTGVGFDNNAPCCVGCVGQNRVYGCQINATVTVNGKQQTLEGTFAGSVTFCPSDAAGSVLTHFKVCRPKPCAVP